MERIEVDVFAPAQEVFDSLSGFSIESIVDVEELSEETLRIVFEGEIAVEITVELGDVFTFVSASVFVNGTDLIIEMPDIGLTFDEDLNPLDLETVRGLGIDYTDADDMVDFVGSVASFEQIFAPVLAAGGDGGEPFSFVDGTRLELGGGTDTVIFEQGAEGIVERVEADGSVTVSLGEDTISLVDAERIEVSDGAYLYDLSEEAPFVYRLYSASLARLPDEGGLRFWDGAFSSGQLSQRQLAQAFVEGREFVDNFLADPSDEAFIEALYLNVLGRTSEGDPGGAFWLDQFQSGRSRADMLIAFADSAENLERTAENYDDGVFVA